MDLLRLAHRYDMGALLELLKIKLPLYIDTPGAVRWLPLALQLSLSDTVAMCERALVRKYEAVAELDDVPALRHMYR